MTIAALSSLLPLPVAIPLAGAVTAPLLARVSSHLAVIVSLLGLAGSTVILLLEAPTVFGGRIIAQYLGNWRPSNGHVLGVTFAADPLGLLVAGFATKAGLAPFHGWLADVHTAAP